MSTEDLIQSAIQDKKLLKFIYHKFERIVEPHVFGVLDGREELQSYQIRGGSSTGGLPEWRRMILTEMSDVEILDQTFPGKRPFPSGKHSSFDRIISLVD